MTTTTMPITTTMATRINDDVDDADETMNDDEVDHDVGHDDVDHYDDCDNAADDDSDDDSDEHYDEDDGRRRAMRCDRLCDGRCDTTMPRTTGYGRCGQEPHRGGELGCARRGASLAGRRGGGQHVGSAAWRNVWRGTQQGPAGPRPRPAGRFNLGVMYSLPPGVDGITAGKSLLHAVWTESSGRRPPTKQRYCGGVSGGRRALAEK